MWPLLQHVYDRAELYTVWLAWVTIPLGFFALYDFLRKHAGAFRRERGSRSEEKGHGAN